MLKMLSLPDPELCSYLSNRILNLESYPCRTCALQMLIENAIPNLANARCRQHQTLSKTLSKNVVASFANAHRSLIAIEPCSCFSKYRRMIPRGSHICRLTSDPFEMLSNMLSILSPPWKLNKSSCYPSGSQLPYSRNHFHQLWTFATVFWITNLAAFFVGSQARVILPCNNPLTMPLNHGIGMQRPTAQVTRQRRMSSKMNSIHQDQSFIDSWDSEFSAS